MAYGGVYDQSPRLVQVYAHVSWKRVQQMGMLDGIEKGSPP